MDLQNGFLREKVSGETKMKGAGDGTRQFS
jgi:hypothetical protein